MNKNLVHITASSKVSGKVANFVEDDDNNSFTTGDYLNS